MPNLTTANRFACAAAIALSLMIFLWRGQEVWSLSRILPGTFVTSGCEEESIFALWRGSHGHAVYSDPQKIPYAAAYFNWLFYAVYSFPTTLATAVFGPEQISLFGRAFTAVGTALGALILFALCKRILAGASLLAGALATFVFFGPLVGWWSYTIRPDVFALVCEISGVGVFLLRYRTKPNFASTTAGLFFYLAWAYKPTFLFGLGGVLLFLCTLRDWRTIGTITLTFCSLVGATLALGPPSYRSALLATATTNVYWIPDGIRNFQNALIKISPLAIVPIGLAFAQSSAPSLSTELRSDALRVGLCGLVVSAPLSFAAACKVGAAPYYFLPVAPNLALISASLLSSRPLPAFQLVCTAGMISLQSIQMAGFAGQITLEPQAKEIAARWELFRRLPEPRYSEDNRLNLPWLNPHSPPLVLAYNYAMDRASGKRFEANGIGGMIRSGYLKGILVQSSPTHFDGASLAGYRATGTTGNFTAYVLTDRE